MTAEPFGSPDGIGRAVDVLADAGVQAVVELSPEAATTELTVARRVLRNIDRMVLRDVEGRPVAAVSTTGPISPSRSSSPTAVRPYARLTRNARSSR